MKSNDFLKAMIPYISAEIKEILAESYGSLQRGVEKLYKVGVEVQLCARDLNISEVRKIEFEIRSRHQLDEFEDYEKIDFLVCFELGFRRKIVPTLEHRKSLKLIFGGLLYAVNRFSGNQICASPRVAFDEEDIARQLGEAQNARWECDFERCYRILNSLDSSIRSASISETVIRHWAASFNDLRIEASFTVGDLAGRNQGIALADQTIDCWGQQQNYVKLTHAYLRKAVLHRQFAQFSTGSTQLFDSIESLVEAEKETSIALRNLKGSEAAADALFGLYCEIAKGYAQVREFLFARQYLQKAARTLDRLVDLRPRRMLDLVRAEAVVMSETNCARNLSEINQLEAGIESVSLAVAESERLYQHDVVLHEILRKELIALLGVAGNFGHRWAREQARSLLKECQSKAKLLNLRHQQRSLRLIALRHHLS